MMLVFFFVILAALTVSEPLPSRGPMPAGRATAAAPALEGRRIVPPRRPLATNRLYSLRARRRLAAYLRMRLLEMREAGLERAADIVRRRLRVDSLVDGP